MTSYPSLTQARLLNWSVWIYRLPSTPSVRKLLVRLEHDFSIEIDALKWINSYLSKRTFFVRVGRSSSAVAQMSSGVPQGSVLGPILFTAYVSPIGRLNELFKVATLCRCALNNGQPTYLASKLIPYRPTRSLRSSDWDLLQEPPCRTKTGARRFSCSAPRIWNSIPRTLRDVQTTSAFKTRLKTYLFDSIYATK